MTLLKLNCFLLVLLVSSEVLIARFAHSSTTDLVSCGSVSNFRGFEPFVSEFNGEAYLCGTHPELGSELFRTNGAPSGTRLIADINTGPGSSDPSAMFELNGHLFYTADDSINGISLWRTKVVGDTEETVRIKTITGAEMHGLTEIFRGKDFVIFRARRSLAVPPNITEVSRTLWRTDGTADGTYRLDPIIHEGPGIRFVSIPSTSTYVAGNRIYYTTLNSLYRFNVLTEQSTLIKEFPNTARSGFTLHIVGGAGGNQIYLEFGKTVRERELWISDGTTGGTSRIQADVEVVGAHNGKVVACGLNSNDVFLIDQHQSDILFTIATDSSNPCVHDFALSDVHLVGGRYIFRVFNEPSFTLFSTDLTVDGSFGLTGPNTNFGLRPIGVTNSKLIYLDPIAGLVSTDGSEQGARKIATINGRLNLALVRREFSVPSSSVALPSVAEPNFLLFIIDNDGDYELWRTTGQASGTFKLLSLPKRATFYLGREGQRRFFKLEDGVIWHSDGTTQGTYPLTYQLDGLEVDVLPTGNSPVLLPVIDLLLDDDN